jgi:hypothetical protein
MEALRSDEVLSTETLVTTHKTTRRHNPEGHNRQIDMSYRRLNVYNLVP